MATVTGVTAQKADQIASKIIVGAQKQGRSLVLQTAGGPVINVPNVFPAPYENYPVGSIYFSTSATNPSSTLGGGTWTRWGNGRVPVGVDSNISEFSTVEKTGGARTHVLSVAEMPAHNHGGATGTMSNDHTHSGTTSSSGAHTHNYEYPDNSRLYGTGGLGAWNSYRSTGATSSAGAHTHTFTTAGASANHTHSIPSQGSSAAHNNLQPYITVYMWKRTA